MVASPGNEAVYSFGGWPGAGNKIFKFSCPDDQIQHCQWEEMGTRLTYPRDDSVAMTIPDVLAKDLHPAVGQGRKAVNHADDRGLACAVRAEQGEEFTRLHRKIHVVYGGELIEPLNYLLGLDDAHNLSQDEMEI